MGQLGIVNFQNQLYHRPLLYAIDKYFAKNGHPCLYTNTPQVEFLRLYQEIGNDILKILDSTSYIQFDTPRQQYKFGKKATTIKFKKRRAWRLINVYKSVKKYGYCCGKFGKTDAIHVKKGFYSKKYGDDSNGCIVLRRHHRAAACVVLGIEKAPCIFYIEKGINHYKY